jgi:hypothetical protein
VILLFSFVSVPQKQPGAKCSTGLLEMKSVDLAAKAILLLNHMQLESSSTLSFALSSNVYHSMAYMFVVGSEFPFLMKLCFSKWSKMQQKSGDSTALIFNTTSRNTPWLFHRYELELVSTVKYKVSRVTRATDEDVTWTLWDTRDLVTEAIDPEAENPVDAQYGSSGVSGTLPEPADRAAGTAG